MTYQSDGGFFSDIQQHGDTQQPSSSSYYEAGPSVYSGSEGRKVARELILEAVAVLRQTEAVSPETQWLLEDCAELLLPRRSRV